MGLGLEVMFRFVAQLLLRFSATLTKLNSNQVMKTPKVILKATMPLKQTFPSYVLNACIKIKQRQEKAQKKE